MTMQFQQQNQTYTPVDNPVILAEADDLLVPAFEAYSTGLLDVRAFNSFYLVAEVTPDAGRATQGEWYCNIKFYAEPTASNDLIVFEDNYVLFQSGVNNMRLTDQMHGGWCKITVEDNDSAPFDMTVDFRFYGSYRSMPNAYMRCSEDGVLYDGVAAVLAPGANDGGDMASLGYGETQIVLTGENAAAGIEIIVGGDTGTPAYRFDTAAAGERGTWRVMLPKQQCWVTLYNTGAVNNTVRAKLYAPPQPY